MQTEIILAVLVLILLAVIAWKGRESFGPTAVCPQEGTYNRCMNVCKTQSSDLACQNFCNAADGCNAWCLLLGGTVSECGMKCF